MKQLEVRATEIKVGDHVLNFAGVEIFVVKAVKIKTGPDFGPGSGWVAVTGDSPDGFFMNNYNGDEEYYEYPSAHVVVERAVEN